MEALGVVVPTMLCWPSPSDLLLTTNPPAPPPTVVMVSGSRAVVVTPTGPPTMGTWHWEQTTELRVFQSRFRSWFKSFFFSSICRSILAKEPSWVFRSLRTCFRSPVRCWDVLRWARQSWRIRLQVWKSLKCLNEFSNLTKKFFRTSAISSKSLILAANFFSANPSLATASRMVLRSSRILFFCSVFFSWLSFNLSLVMSMFFFSSWKAKRTPCSSAWV